MGKSLKFTIFKTKWGYFGLAGTEHGLYSTCLPLPKSEKVKSQLLRNLSLLSQESNIRNPAATQMSLRATCPPKSLRDEGWKRSNLAAHKYEIATTCKAGLAMTGDHRLTRIEYNKSLFKTLQGQIIAYFEGACTDFDSDIQVILDNFRPFTRSVLKGCRQIGFGKSITYSALAKKIGKPDAGRAVGNALAKNPMPLIIPCHRVIRSDGRIGDFSAAGGKNLKARLLKHEKLWNLT